MMLIGAGLLNIRKLAIDLDHNVATFLTDQKVFFDWRELSFIVDHGGGVRDEQSVIDVFGHPEK